MGLGLPEALRDPDTLGVAEALAVIDCDGLTLTVGEDDIESDADALGDCV